MFRKNEQTDRLTRSHFGTTRYNGKPVLYCIMYSENKTKTVIYVNLGKAVLPTDNVWLQISGKTENVKAARGMIQEKLDQYY